MLVLSRKKDESIYINGEEIKITIIDVKDGKVRLGIEAPKTTIIHRQEVYEAIKSQEKNGVNIRRGHK